MIASITEVYIFKMILLILKWRLEWLDCTYKTWGSIFLTWGKWKRSTSLNNDLSHLAIRLVVLDDPVKVELVLDFRSIFNIWVLWWAIWIFKSLIVKGTEAPFINSRKAIWFTSVLNMTIRLNHISSLHWLHWVSVLFPNAKRGHVYV